MTSITVDASQGKQHGLDRRIVVGVDTHKCVHVAVALDSLGARWAP